jgi:hypothetical protein
VGGEGGRKGEIERERGEGGERGNSLIIYDQITQHDFCSRRITLVLSRE